MLNVQKVFLKLVKQSLALAIIFCLSGMASIVCCFTKCQIVEETCHQTSSNLTTESSCQESNFQESETCTTTDETALESSCSQGNTANCCNSDESSNNSITSNSCEFLLTNNLINGFNSDSSCKMKCCLPSEEVLDIPRIPRIDDLKIITTIELSYSTVVKEQVIFTNFPIKKLVNQEKTYLRCCVFLI